MFCCNTVYGYDKIDVGVSQSLIKMDGAFHGKRITIFGTKSAKGDIIIVLEGDKETVRVKHLRKKHLNMWLVDGVREFADVPFLYIMSSSDKMENVVSKEVASSLNFGIANIDIEYNQDDSFVYDAMYAKDALLQKKIQQSLFVEKSDLIIADNSSLFKTDVFLPPNLRYGSYSISSYLIRDGKVVSLSVVPIYAVKVGLSGFLVNLSRLNPTIYALMSVVLTMFLGVVSNYIAIIMFSKKSNIISR